MVLAIAPAPIVLLFPLKNSPLLLDGSGRSPSLDDDALPIAPPSTMLPMPTVWSGVAPVTTIAMITMRDDGAGRYVALTMMMMVMMMMMMMMMPTVGPTRWERLLCRLWFETIQGVPSILLVFHVCFL